MTFMKASASSSVTFLDRPSRVGYAHDAELLLETPDTPFIGPGDLIVRVWLSGGNIYDERGMGRVYPGEPDCGFRGARIVSSIRFSLRSCSASASGKKFVGEANWAALVGVPDSWKVVFMGGGAWDGPWTHTALVVRELQRSPGLGSVELTGLDRLLVPVPGEE
ncbi:hypothetical protein CRG98_005348 [Punica granatum]|uniref:Uncharacterized protein n=1 Tax=Punica granatum TaxID=22663 RepID=A0A2I0L0H9_PUNGR|nr:hypothetical protein CRG98_005348 [Punica granatum]